jgi:seryl-tRNA synthetase
MTLTPDAAFLPALFDGNILLETGVEGLYGRSALHEQLITRLTRMIEAVGAPDNAEVQRYPPMMPRRDFERTGYFRNFGPLVGTVHCFCGDEEAHRTQARLHDAGADWTGMQLATDLVLTPAACYPVYPALAGRRDLSPGGTIIDAASWCFRREPSSDPGRQQMFRMHERIFIGAAEAATAFRAAWIERAQRLAAALALPHEIAAASDPFFGATGRFMARSQRENGLKFELLILLAGPAGPTACASFNLHLTKMSTAWNIRLTDGALAHTACVGFGLDRLALAVFRHHGFNPEKWPTALAKA